MIKSFFANKKWALWAYGGGVFLLISLYAQVHMSVLFNNWYRGFYDILQQVEKHNLKDFFDCLTVFMKIAIPYILLATITNWFTRIYSLRWREAITFGYIPRWRNVKEEIEGASQRIQEDTYRWARIIESLGLQVVRAIMTLTAFLPVLWQLSNEIKIYIPFYKIEFQMTGSLVYTALIVSLGGVIISWFVGKKLPGLEYNNVKVEAAFRKELVLGEDDKKNYSQIPTLSELFLGVRFNYHRLFLHYGYFDIWLNFYDQVMVIVPYIMVGPSLMSGLVTLGVVVQVSNAFQKVHGGFALFIHNWTTVTELRSIWKRLHEFENNLSRYENKK